MTHQSPIKADTVEDALARLDERETWRPALIAYWQREFCSARALRLKQGEPFDSLDIRAIEAIEAALSALREAA